MADVLVVCVRQDVARAEVLAGMFQAAGFSISDDPFDDDALNACGAAVLIWSDASEFSLGFFAAARRAMDAGKAVIANCVGAPSGDVKHIRRVFNLAEWDGRPDDPVLDRLFFAVDRMVVAARDARVAASVVHSAPAAVAAGWLAELPETRGDSRPVQESRRKVALNHTRPPSKARPARARGEVGSIGAMRAVAMMVLVVGLALTTDMAFGGAAPLRPRLTAAHIASPPIMPAAEGTVRFSEVALTQAPIDPPRRTARHVSRRQEKAWSVAPSPDSEATPPPYASWNEPPLAENLVIADYVPALSEAEDLAISIDAGPFSLLPN